jgi:hypothetical protein
MSKTIIAILLMIPVIATAQNWDYIRESGEYYYGVGHGENEIDASERAMADLVGMIATNVSREFQYLMDEQNTNGKSEHQSRVLSCIKTYSNSTLTNVEKWVLGEEPNVTVRRYIKRSEMAKIYEDRETKAKDMVNIAREALDKGKIDMALQYYYWAYSLIRSVQRPTMVKDREGRVLVNWIPMEIESILGDICVKYEKRDGDCVDLLFNYKDHPVSSLEFTYSDGRTDCQGSAKDGRGMIEMVPGYKTDTYHINIEYEYKGQARGDAEMQSVMEVISKKNFKNAEVQVKGIEWKEAKLAKVETFGMNLNPSQEQVIQKKDDYADIITKVTETISKKNYSGAYKYFTLEGLEMYNKLVTYGTGRIVGIPNVKFFKSANGNVVARGLQMSFTFKTGTKKTFVEDVVFTFNKDKKIDNVAFGLGQVAENDILCKYAPGWKNETRELIMEFMESYKTAYCLKRLDYIRSIFADDAIIIIGNVARPRAVQATTYQERPVSLEGQNVIKYNRYSKDEYLKNLERCFKRNEFINIRFLNNEVQWLEKYDKEELFAIQIGQEYNSTTYGDKGYLFLLVDMTDHDSPQIKIRTWQPNEVAMDKLYNAGNFYRE